MFKINEGTEENKCDFKKIVKGSVASIIITLLLLLIYSVVLTYTNVSEKTIPLVIIIITGLSILIGSQMATLHIKKNGVINGALVGAIYIIVIYLLSSIINGNFSLGLNSIIMMISGIIAGGIGGIIGINMK